MVEEESLQSQPEQHRRHHWTIGLTFFKTVRRSTFASSTLLHLSSGASDGFCVSTESFTERQSKIEFEEVMFSKGNMFSIQENDFQVRARQKHRSLSLRDSPGAKIRLLQLPNFVRDRSLWCPQPLWSHGSQHQVFISSFMVKIGEKVKKLILIFQGKTSEWRGDWPETLQRTPPEIWTLCPHPFFSTVVAMTRSISSSMITLEKACKMSSFAASMLAPEPSKTTLLIVFLYIFFTTQLN